ncbi:TDP-N-acetylfucosamine:lipid II N-acetylfucosaminyltransferase [Enterobacter asburiae]|uniref:TDP-N-acetylfucosamine:lipid II N-acetylfucosaminyltransferase n=1 Tax=Enterobacter asburiae TaxID=61645 RepID=UPI002003E9D9|nr:TDP-N-acetylfucosamine:lipid II N-acetylfucosaminyltransferase [Enterobacter asburiae]MCK7228294.1 TDP-N-acetylfucosamine:lipid II N-acetylfucosaminyltransferase [Enterobacter asburiae]
MNHLSNQPFFFHLCPDDKFIDNAINMFRTVFSGRNYVCVYTKNKKAKYVKENIDYHASTRDLLFGVQCPEIEKADVVFIHLLSDTWFRTIEKLNEKTKVVWLGWGGDYYDIILPGDLILLAKTALVQKELSSLRKKTFSGIVRKIIFPTRRKVKVIERINFFSPVLPAEYFMLKNARCWNTFPLRVEWNYSFSEKDISEYELKSSDVISQNSILIGNSATSSGNHLEAFDILERAGVSGRKLVVPLSYGEPGYGKAINHAGKNIFGHYFESITEYMPVDEYVEKISQCGFVIMNHIRQQAVGNIIVLVRMGKKVLLRRESPVYSYLKEHGVHVFSVQDLSAGTVDLVTPLTEKEVAENRKIIDELWSHEKLLEKTRKLIAIFKEEHLRGVQGHE